MAKWRQRDERTRALQSFEEKDQQLQTLQTLQTSAHPCPGGRARCADRHRIRRGTRHSESCSGSSWALASPSAWRRSTLVSARRRLAGRAGGLPLLARIPPPKSRMQKRDELAIVVEPKQAVAEAFRLLRANLDFVRLSAGEVRTILVTSAVQKEGKSTTAANLAVAEARSGQAGRAGRPRLRRPYIDRFFHLRAVEGVTDVALGKLELSEALQRIDLRLGAPEAAAVAPSPSAASSTPVADARRARRPRLGAASARSGGVRGVVPPCRDPRSASRGLRHGDRRHATRPPGG